MQSIPKYALQTRVRIESKVEINLIEIANYQKKKNRK